MKKLTIEEFTRRAREIHGDCYDYSKVEYKGNKVKVCIICPIHGEFWQKPNDHLMGHGCPECSGKNQKDTERFIQDARKVHGDRYDYSKVDYKNSKTKICIICPIHGEFWQSPNVHLKGSGCRKCYAELRKKLRYGVGINDMIGQEKTRLYKAWSGMLAMCYCKSYRNIYKSYENISICDEWLRLSNFKKWFDENYVEGYSLDKDILVKGNKVYSPDTCCFVPQEINMLVVQQRGEKNKGIFRTRKGYAARISVKHKYTKIGVYDTIEEAINAYREAKKSHIRNIATLYYNQGAIKENVYQALINYTL